MFVSWNWCGFIYVIEDFKHFEEDMAFNVRLVIRIIIKYYKRWILITCKERDGWVSDLVQQAWRASREASCASELGGGGRCERAACASPRGRASLRIERRAKGIAETSVPAVWCARCWCGRNERSCARAGGCGATLSQGYARKDRSRAPAARRALRCEC